MKRTIAIFGMILAYAVTMSSIGAAAENKAEPQKPIILAQAKQPTDADKKKLADEIQRHYKPGPGKSSTPSGTTRMDSGTASSCTQSTAQIAACSGACSASCILKCNPVTGSFPWSSDCKSCVNDCMDHCTGCGKGSVQ